MPVATFSLLVKPDSGLSRIRSNVAGSDDVEVHVTVIGFVGSIVPPVGEVIVSALAEARNAAIAATLVRNERILDAGCTITQNDKTRND